MDNDPAWTKSNYDSNLITLGNMNWLKTSSLCHRYMIRIVVLPEQYYTSQSGTASIKISQVYGTNTPFPAICKDEAYLYQAVS